MKIKVPKSISYFLTVLFLISSYSCKKNQEKEAQAQSKEIEKVDPFFKLSLAQWSLHRTFNEQGVNPFKFAEIAKENGFEGLEYVNQIYTDEIKKLGFDAVIDSLKVVSENAEMQNVLIMVDGEGDLADPDEEARNLAVENHKKWVDAAQELGCHSIRVNTFGTNDPELWIPAVVDGLKKLSDYASTKNINILCENHGWLSSDVPVLIEAVKQVDMENCGTLPDFGNWCIQRENGERWGQCIEEYPNKYEGIETMLTKAKAVSAKSYDFDENGNETTLDYPRIVKLIKDSGYKGYIGVEYEGDRLPEKEGIKATRNLLLKSAKSLQ
ncbi:sugar phosphate isomerase/epimerase [Psychroflexus sp. CAK57W]|uniref:sugar phosphate isomerase/epimerase family protein n=1 Tax=Psychroflexus curvus TaxID=2873595 RepID=UPI001CCD3D52|nr:sugar phosphate isomerase/epimerase family protein [Psychroflexus curvus]MBZ9786353.1 sugar phosphate isomerase/epimerase [Psychroflexus curvus]